MMETTSAPGDYSADATIVTQTESSHQSIQTLNSTETVQGANPWVK